MERARGRCGEVLVCTLPLVTLEIKLIILEEKKFYFQKENKILKYLKVF